MIPMTGIAITPTNETGPTTTMEGGAGVAAPHQTKVREQQFPSCDIAPDPGLCVQLAESAVVQCRHTSVTDMNHVLGITMILVCLLPSFN